MILSSVDSAGVRLQHWTELAVHAGVLAAIHCDPLELQDCSITRKTQDTGLRMPLSRGPIVASVLPMYLSRSVLTVMVDMADVSACQRGDKAANECRW